MSNSSCGRHRRAVRRRERRRSTTTTWRPSRSHRPPDNYFDVALIRSLAEAYEALDADAGSRAIVLCSEGKHFCAGADFTGRSGRRARPRPATAGELYREAVRLFEAATAGGGRRPGRGHRRRARPGLLGRLPGGRARRPASPPTSPGSASTTASGCRSPCRPSSASSTRPRAALHRAARHRRARRPASACATGWSTDDRPGARPHALAADDRRSRRRWPCASIRETHAGRAGRAGPARPPSGSWPSRTGCSGPPTSPRASAPPPSAGRPGSRADDGQRRVRPRRGAGRAAGVARGRTGTPS